MSVVRLHPLPDIFAPSGSLITVSRNECVARFRRGDWSHLFFIDADIGFQPETFWRLVTSGYDVSASAYPFKRDDMVEQGGFVVDSAELGPIGTDGFATIQNAPTGFMCIARGAIEKLAGAGIGRNEFFDTMRFDDEYLAEDHAFCKRWHDIGGEIHLDTRAILTHQGVKIYDKGRLMPTP
ncbi:MAG TPA: hypothetical protein VFX37_15145 [Pseudolabrys sp.]|nr:hypothetical protein [Pseudolabrys sp.]